MLKDDNSHTSLEMPKQVKNIGVQMINNLIKFTVDRFIFCALLAKGIVEQLEKNLFTTFDTQNENN